MNICQLKVLLKFHQMKLVSEPDMTQVPSPINSILIIQGNTNENDLVKIINQQFNIMHNADEIKNFFDPF